jgi:hypothetical protein
MNEAQAAQISPEDLIVALQNNIEVLRRALTNARKSANRYEKLREQEVIIMAPEGTVYLKNKELDKYVDSLRLLPDIGIVAQQVSVAP